MKVLAAVLLGLLAGAFAQNCNCNPPADARAAYEASTYMVWAKVTKVNPKKTQYTVELVQATKSGCRKAGDVGLVVTTKNRCGQSFSVGETYLIAGKKMPGAKFKMKVDCSSWVGTVDDSYGPDLHWLSSRTEKCKKKYVCPDGSDKTTCKPLAKVCGLKKNYPAGSASCLINPCSGCQPEFFSKKFFKGVRKGTDCATCTTNPCEGMDLDWVAQRLGAAGCEDTDRLARCVVDSCHGCTPIWTDAYGNEVCKDLMFKNTCQDFKGVNFGGGKKKLGFGVVNGNCAEIVGQNARGLHLFETEDDCNANCRCQDVSSLDYNSAECDDSLGWGVGRDGTCMQIKGCKDHHGKTANTLFPGKAKCSQTCGPLVTVVSTPAPTPAPRLNERCPEDKPFTTCRVNPCSAIRPPRCPEAANTVLQCVPDYCGGCHAHWFHDGRPFECPSRASCTPGSAGCCDDLGLVELQCGNDCDPSLCDGAATCELSACNNCEVRFFDSSGAEIPRYTCRRAGEVPSGQRPGLPRPPSWVTQADLEEDGCNPEDEGCCRSGKQPEVCRAELEATVCTSLECPTVDGPKCALNPCNNCDLMVTDSEGASVDVLRHCYLDPCPGVKCPDVPPSCGPLPESCARSGHEFECRIAKCECLSYWHDLTNDAPATCLPFDWQPQCIETCPAEVPCPPAKPNLPSVQDWVCEAEPCLCRGWWKPVCNDNCPQPAPEACDAPRPGMFPPDTALECRAAPCTCEPVIVPQGCILECPTDLQCAPVPEEDLCDPNNPGQNCLTPELIQFLECVPEPCTCNPVLRFPPAFVAAQQRAQAAAAQAAAAEGR